MLRKLGPDRSGGAFTTLELSFRGSETDDNVGLHWLKRGDGLSRTEAYLKKATEQGLEMLRCTKENRPSSQGGTEHGEDKW